MKLLTIKELSGFTKIKKSTLYAWAGKRLIPVHKLNGLLRFDLEEIEEWIENSKVVPMLANNFKPVPAGNIDIDTTIKRAIESVNRQGYNPSQQRSQTKLSPERR